MVAKDSLPPQIANTIAAIVNMRKGAVVRLNIVKGSAVVIVGAGRPSGPAGKVVRIDCDEQNCSIIVSLPKLAGQSLDSDALASAELKLEEPPPQSVGP
jgi:hypothetical protein